MGQQHYCAAPVVKVMVQIDSSEEECLHTLDEDMMAYLHVLSVTVWTWCSEDRGNTDQTRRMKPSASATKPPIMTCHDNKHLFKLSAASTLLQLSSESVLVAMTGLNPYILTHRQPYFQTAAAVWTVARVPLAGR